LARFRTTLDFDCKYFRIERRYRQAEKGIINCNHFRVGPKIVIFGSLTPEITLLIFTHFKSTLRVLRMLMHSSLGQVTLLPGEFQSFKFSPIGFAPLGGLTLDSALSF